MSNAKKTTKTNMLGGLVASLDRRLQDVYDKRKLVFLLGASLLIVVWQWPLLLSTNSLLSGDFDYFTQAYEAIRKSVFEYHQFPWMNAWIGGGVPLYANPQVGIFSFQTLLVFVFGAPFGLKLSIIAYSLIGFWSMFYLLRHNFKATTTVALGLSSVWVTNGFFVAHLVSHYSFGMFLIFPLLLYLLINISRKRYWLYLGVASALSILSAFHYAVFQGFLILGFVAVFLLFSNPKGFKTCLLLYAKASAVFLLLAGHRIFYVLQYVSDFPRAFSDEPNSLLVSMKSFVIPYDDRRWFYDLVSPGRINYTWTEHTVFIGYFISLALVALLLGGLFIVLRNFNANSPRGLITDKLRNLKVPILLAALLVFSVLVSMGDFGKFSPYSLLGNLPAFSGMRVPSRWLIWSVFVGLLLIGSASSIIKNPKLRAALAICVLLGALEVYAVSIGNDRFFYNPVVFREPKAQFEQFEDFDRNNLPTDLSNYKVRPSYDRRGEIYSYEATLNNFGQSRGYEPIADTYYAPTNRCGVTQGCGFVKSDNARVQYWSPNKIVLERTRPGPIELNINPSNYWLVNNSRIYGESRTVEVLANFVITDKSDVITLRVIPRSPLETTVSTLKRLIN